MLRIGMIDNISMTAYRLVRPDFPTEMEHGNPTEVALRFSQGVYEAAQAPTASLHRLGGAAHFLGEYGLACEGAVHSVGFFSDRPLEVLLQERRPVYLTPHSQTSRLLFKILCWQDFACAPVLCSGPESAEGRLLIGQEGLAARHRRPAWKHHIDMGAWWQRRTSLPFVFARWIVQPSVPEAAQTQLLIWLEETTSLAKTEAGSAGCWPQPTSWDSQKTWPSPTFKDCATA